MTERTGTQYNRGCKNPGCSREKSGMLCNAGRKELLGKEIYDYFQFLEPGEWAHIECYIDLCVQDSIRKYLDQVKQT